MQATQEVAIGGYDSVAYFEGRPAKGTDAFEHHWAGRVWRFATAQHRDAFAADPNRYAPQNDGTCAFAAAVGKTGPTAPVGSPIVWTVAGGKLYLSSNRIAHTLWHLLFGPKGLFFRWIGGIVLLLAVLLGASAIFAEASLPTGDQPGATLEEAHPWLGPVSEGSEGIAIQGYDPVAYFVQSEAVKGSGTYSTDWNGSTWHFASAENLAVFEGDPEAYAPQFGGHCSFAAGLGQQVEGSPTQWRIVDGRLFLNANAAAALLWRALPGRGPAAYANWSGATSS